jgi:hypothetical protein
MWAYLRLRANKHVDQVSMTTASAPVTVAPSPDYVAKVPGEQRAHRERRPFSNGFQSAIRLSHGGANASD